MEKGATLPGSRWFRIWEVVAALGLVLACVLLGVGVTIALWAVGAFLAALLLLTFRASHPAETGLGDGFTLCATVTQAGAFGAAFVACCAFATLSPGLALILVTLATASSPFLRQSIRRIPRGRAGDDVIPNAAGDHTPPPAPSERAAVASPSLRRVCDPVGAPCLTNEELCHTWRRTFLLLQQDVDPAATAALVSIRQGCLDEMERRNPDGLQAWLASGARAAGSPEKFLTAPTDDGQPEVA